MYVIAIFVCYLSIFVFLLPRYEELHVIARCIQKIYFLRRIQIDDAVYMLTFIMCC